MGCKSCKKNKSSNLVKTVINLKKGLNKTTNNIPKDYELFNYEKVLLVIFGWTPICVGYYHIVRFIINLF